MASLLANSLVLALGILIFSRPAHAYIDPGTGSMVIQAVGAMILAALVTMRIWMAAFKRVIRRLTGKKASASDSSTP